ncbi:Ig-like domain repeat protein [Promicromonospora vindobonensis]|uniref:Ig-like domain repeat protein n=1 Tax=Promicromonospora vindobonensis TaxID=195748 RepID=A0ABW5W0P4_9MICO
MRINTARRTGFALVTAIAVALTGFIATPAAALAPNLDPGNRLGGITFDVDSGEISYPGGPQRLTTETGCPAGYRNSSRVMFVWSDGTWPERLGQSDAGLPALFYGGAHPIAGTGLDGNPIDRVNSSTTQRFASRWNGGGFPAARFDGHSGVASYVITCDPGTVPSTTVPTATEGVASAKYFSTDVRITWNDATDTGTWEVVPDVPIEKVDTTTTLTGAALNDGRVRLTAAVAPSAASGAVTFKSGDGSTIATENMSGGTATTVVGGLEADNEYTFTAEYAGDASHEASTSGTLTVTTVGEPVPPQDTEITVTIPASAQGLRFTVSPGGVALAQAELDGEQFVATGTLQEVRVTDTRTDRKQWTLNGRTSDFDGPGEATIDGSALGWKPELVGTGNAGTAGTEVTPGAGGGLSADKPLAQALAGVTQSDTRVGAGITLRAPADTAAGDYAATLTLTLI